MFFHSHIAKRVIASFGILLTAVSCGQQTHAFCELYDCTQPDKEQLSDDCCQKHLPKKKCSHSHAPECGKLPKVQSPLGAANCQPAVPCDEGCLCCQTPSPQQAPAPLDAESVTQPSATCSCTTLTAAWVDADSSRWSTTSSQSSPERALDICVRLCRFMA